MIAWLFISFLVGAALGQRFKVFVLLPATSLVLICTIAAGIARAPDVWSIAVAAVCVTIALQIGYLIGTGIRYLFAADGRARRRFFFPI
jgi:multisubunit Na+/H+ antiporter MnhG subunit